jgi:hypothetical protein
MTRQPFWSVYKKDPVGELTFSAKKLGLRPALKSIIGECLMTWPIAEAEMGLLLGQLLGMPSMAAIAVFQVLRRSANQREAIGAAANTALETKEDKELISALLYVHKSIEAERNALAHGHFGIHDKFTDMILWITTETYVKFKTETNLANIVLTTQRKLEFYSEVYFYRDSDLRSILSDINAVCEMWASAIIWLRARPPSRAELYLQLCNQSRIAQALDVLRQKNKNATLPESRSPDLDASI